MTSAAVTRWLLSGRPAVRVIEQAGEERVVSASLEALAPFRTGAGGYAIENAWKYVIATV